MEWPVFVFLALIVIFVGWAIIRTRRENKEAERILPQY